MPVPHDERFQPNRRLVPYDHLKGRYLEMDRYANTKLKVFFLVEEYGDFLVCNDGATTIPAGTPNLTKEFLIAKPYLLRQTPFDGVSTEYPGNLNVTYTYTTFNGLPIRQADDDDGILASENQKITPSYYVGESILCGYLDTGMRDPGGTGYEGTVRDATNKKIAWEDMDSGKSWALLVV